MTIYREKGGDGSPAIDIQDGYHGVRVGEHAALSASPIACAVADATQSLRNAMRLPAGDQTIADLRDALDDALDALEVATRKSPLRKVRP